VTATASGGTNNIGVSNQFSSPKIQNSVVAASGGTSYGIDNVAPSGPYTVQVSNSRITAATHTIHNDLGFTTQVGASQLDGGAVDNTHGGTLTCIFAYNGSFAALGANCQ